MFDNLSERLGRVLKNLRGTGRITEENVQETMREVRTALLEADVALSVVQAFTAKVRERALGQEVAKSLNPGQAFVKIVNDELVAVMGGQQEEIHFNVVPPVIILLAGLQGSGKTTTAAKLARWLKEVKKKTVLMTSIDIYRPAAIQQLETLAREIQVEFFPSHATQRPDAIAREAISHAKKHFIDVVIVDTAGRLHIDDAMMTEIKAVHAAILPHETLFVVDSMTGQDAANAAKAFHDVLPLTGIILTKTDGDARGGAALSVRYITGKPIKFIGVGEKTDALEAFYPDRMASRILGMGDVLSLVEEVERKIDKEKAAKMVKKLKAKGFDFEDFRDQIQQMKNMGGLGKLITKLPGVGNLPAGLRDQVMGDKTFNRYEAMINSMTVKERRFPAIIKGSRKQRIAKGSGTTIPEVNKLLKQFEQMQKMMKKLKGGKMKGMLRQMQHLMPPGGGNKLPF